MRTVRHILLIDDNGAVNTIHRELFRINGFRGEISLCHSTTQGLKQLSNENLSLPGLIFLDLKMPQTNGWEFLEVMKEMTIEGLLDIPVIILTASQDPNDRQKATEYKNVKGYLTKPLAFAELDKILKSLVKV